MIQLRQKSMGWKLIGNMANSLYWLGVLFVITVASTSCDKDTEPDTPIIETDSITDVSGNVYTIVKIGDDWWMAENLATTQYRDGSPVELLQNNASNWENGLPAYCRYEDNTLAPGMLYNWAAVNNSAGLAPAGWHIATEEEWQTLERHLGMAADEIEKVNWRESGACGDKLKTKGPTGWLNFEGVWGTNESGFSALAGSCRLWNGSWANPGLSSNGYWWTSTEKDSTAAYFRNLDYKKSGVFRFYVDKRYGMSVRCVKDK
jgi:uncharacterized protein (TIGR02145 family)